MELDKIWWSKALLLFKDTVNLQKTSISEKKKRLWLFNYLKNDFNILSMSLILGIIISILSLAIAVYSQKLIDILLPSNNTFKIVASICLLFFLLFLNTFLSFIRELFTIRQGRDFNIRIIDFFYTYLMKLPKQFFDTRKTGDMVTRMNDTSRIQRTITKIANTIFIDILMIVISSIVIFSYNKTLGLISLSWIPIYTILILFFNSNIIKKQKIVMQAYAKNESNYIDTIQGIETIKANSKEFYFSNFTKSIYQNYQNSIFNLNKLALYYSSMSQLLSNVFITSVLSFSVYLVLKGEIKSGVVIAVLQLAGMIMQSTSNLAMINIDIQEAKIAFNRMFEFASAEKEKSGEISLNNFHSLEIKDASFRFAGRKELLKNINISVKKGALIAIVGESGSGKSTLGQVLQKFYQFEKGNIIINNTTELNDVSTENWRNLIGVIPQDIHIFSGNVLDNILLGAEDTPKKVVEFCQKMGFEKFIAQFPQGYTTILGEEGINLSGGQKQIIAFARALYKKPQFLILDEPTAAMDRNTERFTLNLLSELKKDMGILLISHRLHSLKNTADRIYILENNTISNQGNHEELLKTNNFYSAYWQEILI